MTEEIVKGGSDVALVQAEKKEPESKITILSMRYSHFLNLI
jgi:hypothetical protein